jgi:hypothetical protein
VATGAQQVGAGAGASQQVGAGAGAHTGAGAGAQQVGAGASQQAGAQCLTRTFLQRTFLGLQQVGAGASQQVGAGAQLLQPWWPMNSRAASTSDAVTTSIDRAAKLAATNERTISDLLQLAGQRTLADQPNLRTDSRRERVRVSEATRSKADGPSGSESVFSAHADYHSRASWEFKSDGVVLADFDDFDEDDDWEAPFREISTPAWSQAHRFRSLRQTSRWSSHVFVTNISQSR